MMMKIVTLRNQIDKILLTTHAFIVPEVISTASKFFEEMFTKKSEQEIESILPKKMAKPFTTKEIKDAIKSLKNGKSAGIDNVY